MAIIEYIIANDKECHLCMHITLFSHDLSQGQTTLSLDVEQACCRY